ncbi:preprotein translocase subunit SecY [Candidatus Parcubacteria bacterium]|nr:preprotein translocase subunit SecY [Candidatus Parcubacteria bacterium]
MWLNKVIQVFRIQDLRKKILFVLFIFIIFRLMANIPIPGIDSQGLQKLFEQFQMLGLLNVFSGGALSNLSIVMLGLGPYITAVIILQLLTMIIPAFERMYKEEGEQGRQKFNQYGRMLTVPLAMIQGYAMLTLLQRQNPPVIEPLSLFMTFGAIMTVTAGAVFLMWLGELITERGIGNGVSLLIFAGIIASFPSSILQMFADWDSTKIFPYFLFFVMALVIIAGVVLINEARRNIPISYAKRVRGMKMFGGVSTYLPLNINPAGVIPIIFALSIMLFPGMTASFLGGVEGIVGNMATSFGAFFENPWIHGIFYFALVIMFVYFYTAVTFDPKNIANNLQKMGGFVPGIRPGKSTVVFLSTILNRVLLVGALSLGLIALLPSIVPGVIQAITGEKIMTFQFLIGGTSLLIVVAVVLDTMKQINAQLQMREYETF